MEPVKSITMVNKVFYELLVESDCPETNLFKWVIIQAFWDISNQAVGAISAIDFLNNNRWEWRKKREEVCDLAFTESSWLTASIIQGIYLGYSTDPTIRARINKILAQWDECIYLNWKESCKCM